MKKIELTLLAACAGYVILVVIFLVEQMMGVLMPRPVIFPSLSGSMLWVGWVASACMSFVVAVAYTWFFNNMFSWIKNTGMRGVVYGVLVSIIIIVSMLYATNDEITSLNGAIEAYGIMIAYVAYGFVLGRIVGRVKN